MKNKEQNIKKILSNQKRFLGLDSSSLNDLSKEDVLKVIEHSILATQEISEECHLCKENYEPNEETLKALEEVSSLSGGKTFKTVEELFEDIDNDDGYEDAPPETVEAIRASWNQPNISSIFLKGLDTSIMKDNRCKKEETK